MAPELIAAGRASTLWVSRRRGSGFVWTELDAGTGAATGRTVSGGSNCADATDDPAFPQGPGLRAITRRLSEVRTISLAEVIAPRSAPPARGFKGEAR